RRDQSYQDSIVKPVAQAGRMVADTPVGYLIPGNSARKSAEKQNENKLIELRDNTEILTQTKAKEIQDGIRAGVYDPQKAQTAIQELLAVN
ncbi:hypothetical protein U2086_14730, partial [Listeria monocytogenes]|uniref:hypothetical protein n=1 Tax=Listeria monocytogenes TaxID=1639 RepID=UPI002FDBD0C5